jgi:hypothetical protein
VIVNGYHNQIVLTHWNAGVFRASVLPQLLPELAVYSLLYDEVLIREEDLITNRRVLKLLSQPNNFAVFSEMLMSGLVKLLRLPLDTYPSGRKFDPVRLPISARVEEHEVRRSYKGKPWKATRWEWQLFERLDGIIATYPSASRYHAPFAQGNMFAAQMADILENRTAFQLSDHPVFGHLDDHTADQFLLFSREPEAWQRFLHDHDFDNPITGADSGFYRSAAYQCSDFLPTPRAARRLVESVYAATYYEREGSDGRYGGSELVELPFRYESDAERAAAAEEACRIEVTPTLATATIKLQPGIARVLAQTRESNEFRNVRQSIEALGNDPDSPLLAEARFRDAWQNLCALHAENSVRGLETSSRADHRIVRYGVVAYLLARVMGFLVVPTLQNTDLPVVEDAIAIAAMEKIGAKNAAGLSRLNKDSCAAKTDGDISSGAMLHRAADCENSEQS